MMRNMHYARAMCDMTREMHDTAALGSCTLHRF